MAVNLLRVGSVEASIEGADRVYLGSNVVWDPESLGPADNKITEGADNKVVEGGADNKTTEGTGAPPENLAPGTMDDIYSAWENDSNFVVGSRLQDPAEMNAIATPAYGYQGAPDHFIVQDDDGKDCLEIAFAQGQTSLAEQIRLEWPELNPGNSTMITVVWHYKTGQYWTGGKMFQIGQNNGVSGGRRFEFNPTLSLGPNGVGPPTIFAPSRWRTYIATTVGGNGDQAALSINPWPSRNVQPPLDCPDRNYQWDYARDHITNPTTGRCFLCQPDEWYRVIATIDFTTSPHGFWCWMESESTERTLVMSEDPAIDPNRGFRLQHASGNDGLDWWWIEFNNSSTQAAEAFRVKNRDFFVVRDVRGDQL